MWEERAHRARREIAALASEGLGPPRLHEQVVEHVGRVVGVELACCALLDPDALAITGMVSGRTPLPPQYEPLLARAESTPGEPHTFATLAARRQRSARLSDLAGPLRDRSVRLRTVWRPLGIDREVRVPLVLDRKCWGALALVRTGPDFSPREVEYLVAVAPALAAATRSALSASIRSTAHDGLAAASAVVTPAGEVRASTASARRWRARWEDHPPGRFSLWLQVAAARAHGSIEGTCRMHVQDGDGRWVSLRAARLEGADEPLVAVTLEPLAGEDVTRLLMATLGLTVREQEVCREVLSGWSTAEIASRLSCSPLTVQDHLKSVFAKAGVHSRGQLASLLRP